MKDEIIMPGARLAEIIRDELLCALEKEKVRTSEDVEYYLVNLLKDFHIAGQLPDLNNEETPLVVRFMEAMSEHDSMKISSLKNIGDGTLVALGFFAENIRRSIVGTSYYISIGGSAYETLAGLLVCDQSFAKVYAELASKFASLVDALARIAPCNRASSATELLSIYRRWMSTGDDHLGDILLNEGIISESRGTR